MTTEEFKKILESFPGKEDLKKQAPNNLEFANYDFVQISIDIKKSRICLDMRNDEDLWCRVLSFLEIANWYILKADDRLCLLEDDVMNYKSLKISKDEIAPKLQEKMKVKLHSAAGIMLAELHTFLKNGNNLF